MKKSYVIVSSYVSFTIENVTMWVPKKEEKIDHDMVEPIVL